MATVTFSLVNVCDGGGHVRLGVSVDGGPTRQLPFLADEMRQPITEDMIETAALVLLRFHFQGKTRAQARTELQAGVAMVI